MDNGQLLAFFAFAWALTALAVVGCLVERARDSWQRDDDEEPQ